MKGQGILARFMAEERVTIQTGFGTQIYILLFGRYQWLFVGIKRPESESVHSPSSNVVVKNAFRLYLRSSVNLYILHRDRSFHKTFNAVMKKNQRYNLQLSLSLTYLKHFKKRVLKFMTLSETLNQKNGTTLEWIRDNTIMNWLCWCRL